MKAKEQIRKHHYQLYEPYEARCKYCNHCGGKLGHPFIMDIEPVMMPLPEQFKQHPQFMRPTPPQPIMSPPAPPNGVKIAE